LFEIFLGMLNDCDDVQEIYHNISRNRSPRESGAAASGYFC
jgi:hypothetical protein